MSSYPHICQVSSDNALTHDYRLNTKRWLSEELMFRTNIKEIIIQNLILKFCRTWNWWRKVHVLWYSSVKMFQIKVIGNYFDLMFHFHEWIDMVFRFFIWTSLYGYHISLHRSQLSKQATYKFLCKNLFSLS